MKNRIQFITTIMFLFLQSMVIMAQYGDSNMLLKLHPASNNNLLLLPDHSLNDEPLSFNQGFLNDLGISLIIAPESGDNMAKDEIVSVQIKNFGDLPQSNFEVSYSLNWGSPVMELITQSVNPGETIEYTFIETVDLSEYGPYLLESCTHLLIDGNPGNDCMLAIIENQNPYYCHASTGNQFEWIDYVICGTINHASSWQNGVSNNTNISTTIAAGMSEDIYFVNGNPIASDMGAVWVDWNRDTLFQTESDEEYIMTHDGTGEIFTGTILVPENTLSGDYRMRVRLVQGPPINPCGYASNGEVEDYTIEVVEITRKAEFKLATVGVYPNPASSVLEVRCTESMNQISMTNLSGKQVVSYVPDRKEFQMDVSELEAGMYLLYTKTDHGVVTNKVIINR